MLWLSHLKQVAAHFAFLLTFSEESGLPCYGYHT